MTHAKETEMATERTPTLIDDAGRERPVVHAADRWTRQTDAVAYRVWSGRLYRREVGPLFYGGYQIKYVSLANERLVHEWTRGGPRPASRSPSPYAKRIEATLAERGFEAGQARRVEAFMRAEVAPTLDGLSPSEFDAAVVASAEAALEAGPEMADALAQSLGL